MFRFAGYLSLALFLFFGNLNSQVLYQVSLENAALTDQNNFEFDVFIKSNSGTFELTSYQCALTYHSKISNGGTLNFSYINESSDLSNPPSTGIGIYKDNSINKLTFASMPGSDIINSSREKIGRFRIQNTNAFGSCLSKIISLGWNFDGSITTILTGTSFTNITNPENHITFIEEFEKLLVINSISSDTATSVNHPAKSLDGLGYFDNDDLSYWKAEPVPQYIIYDFRNIRAVSLTRFSFYNFNSGQKFIYSIQLSADNVNWVEMVTYDTSSNIEYTENLFEPTNARYVKLLLHSNNQNMVSSIWEAEIWGDNDALLPVELKSFTLSIKDEHVELKWETITEVNNYGFEIQRSEDKTGWDVIGFVNGNGNSNIPHNYQFTDKDKLPDGNYYYRLKQIDTDGAFEYSPVLEIEINNIIEEYTLSQNYPNPFNPTTKINFSLPSETKVTVEIFNVLGEMVLSLIDNEILNSGKHEIIFDGSGFASGIYFYTLYTEKFSLTKKMILLQ